MHYNNNLGKLIISKWNDNYNTFHNLKLILVKGSRNIIDIGHDVIKLVIEGNNNKIEIDDESEVREMKIRGNNNDIFIHALSSLIHMSDYGNGNEIYYKKRIINERNHSSDEDNFNGPDENIDYNNDNDNDEINSDQYEDEYAEYNDEDSNHNDYDSEKRYDLIDINFKNSSKGVKNDKDKCIICYENFKENESVKMTSCFHIFHFNCIKKWIDSKEDLDEIPECPICRREL